VNGTINPDEPFIVENDLGQTIYVLFRNTTLSNEFGFKFFSQSPQLTARELIQQLAQIYMSHPGGVVTVALDGENPLIFNPVTGPVDLYAIYSSLS
jgi:alpha-amylase/alpha-mannosidase (GH57 family)